MARLGMAGGEGFEGGFEIVEWVDVVHFAGADERGEQAPVLAAFVMTGE